MHSTMAHIVLPREEHTVRPFPLIDALGKSNIYRNVMAWQPSIKLVITGPIQRRDRMPCMTSAWQGEGRVREGGHLKQLFCRIVCRTPGVPCVLLRYLDGGVRCCAKNLTFLIGVVRVKQRLPNTGVTCRIVHGSVIIDKTNTAIAPV